MSPTLFKPDQLLETAPPPKAVPVAIGSPVSAVRSIAINSPARATNRFGIWECSPGTWRRQIAAAEFCHFLAGRATFTPDGGTAIEIVAGDVVHFPEKSFGEWTIIEPSRKIFLIFDEEAQS